MAEQHPITPPPELVQQWYDAARGPCCEQELATQAARWGADQELGACCEWVSCWCSRFPDGSRPEDALCAARRPKPPSLKQQALDALEEEDDALPLRSNARGDRFALIRRALEQLDD